VIGPGQMPRLRVVRLRRLAYIRVRRRVPRRVKFPVIATSVRDTELTHGTRQRTLASGDVSFDHGPAEFPIATLRPRAPIATLIAWAGDLQRWLGERVAFVRPRTIPLIAAMVGMLGTAAAAHYLQRVEARCSPAVSATLTNR
jgi:hypothetical protein